MWEYYHKTIYRLNSLAASPDVIEYARKAYASVRTWLMMKPNLISSVTMKRFRLYIMDKEETVSLCPTSMKEKNNHLYYDIIEISCVHHAAR
jgi:hypothetical protein